MNRIPLEWADGRPSRADEDRYGAGRHGYQNQDSLLSIPATLADERVFNDVQEALVRVIEGAGLAPNGIADSEDNFNQLLQAILLLINNANTGTWAQSRSAGEMLEQFRGITNGATGRVVIVGGNTSAVIQTSDDDGDTWTTRLADSATDRLNAVAYSGSELVAVGDTVSGDPIIYRSTDNGVTWASVANSIGKTLNGITWDSTNSVFIAVGNNGTIVTSTDGTSWIAQTSGTSRNLRAVVHDGVGLTVAVGFEARIRTSPDSTTWTTRPSPHSSSTHYYALAYNAVSGDWLCGGTSGRMAKSGNGTTWAFVGASGRPQSGGSEVANTLFGLGHGGGKWLAAFAHAQAAYVTSNATGDGGWSENDLDDFGETESDLNMNAAHYSGTKYVIAGEKGEIQNSPAGTTWTHRDESPLFIGTLHAITWSGTKHVMVGADAEIQCSSNGINWNRCPADAAFTGGFFGVTWGGGLFVAVGENGEIQTSPDGSTWTRRTAAGSYSGDFHAITHDGSQFIAVGSSGEIQSSSDGITWAQETNDGSYAGTFMGAGYDGSGLIVIVGTSGEIQSSPDGSTWTAESSAGGYSGTFEGVSHKASLWCIVGASGEIETSSDGSAWTQRTPAGGYSSSFNAVHASGNKFTACGDSGEIQSSLDGTTWLKEITAGGYSSAFQGGVFGALERVICGEVAEIQRAL